ncbi:MAG: hypothetical protein GX810_03470, partial [Clostridiales bacterium]|nr:hypothetical protein [Clostridiales bacterium]
MKFASQATIRRLAAWAMSLMILLTPALGWAMPIQLPVEARLDWTAPDGTPKTALATQVPYPGYENALWLYVEAEAIEQDATLSLTDTFGQYLGGFALVDGRRLDTGLPLSNLPYTDAGMAPADMYLEILAFPAPDQLPVSYQLYFSLMAEQPEPPLTTPEVTAEPTQAPDAQVSVFYVDESGNPIVEGSTEYIPADSARVITAPANIGEYLLTGAAEQQVWVDANGIATPAQVTFTYALPATPE